MNAQKKTYLDLNSMERQTLDDKIIPTAREWLDIPSLRQHAVKTLDYWNQPFHRKADD